MQQSDWGLTLSYYTVKPLPRGVEVFEPHIRPPTGGTMGVTMYIYDETTLALPQYAVGP